MKKLLLLFVIFIFIPTLYGQQRAIDKQFLEAVQNRDVPRINALLKSGANINAREPINGYFALQYAINWPDISLVKLLLDNGANVNLADKGGSTALTNVARRGGPVNTAILKLLVERGADIHADNASAIVDAAREAEPEVVRLLLAKGAPPNARNKDRINNTALMEAAGGRSVENVQLLLAAGADLQAVNNEGQTALMAAVRLDHRYRPSDRLPIIELLLNRGAEINQVDKSGQSPLLLSVRQHMSEAGGVVAHAEVVKLLLDRGANVQAKDERGDTALVVTAGVWRGSIEIAKLLLNKGINVNAQNKKGATALMVAVARPWPELVNLLLTHGADINLKDAEGETALDAAVSNGQSQIAKLLHARGARSKTNYKSEAELIRATINRALLGAASRNNVNELKEHVAAGADLGVRDNRGMTALMLAIENSYGRIEAVKFLIEKGIDLNAVDTNGNSALMIAVDRNNDEAVTLLLEQKVSVYLFNKERRTALHIAAAGLHERIVEALLNTTPQVSASSAGVDVRGIEVNGLDVNGRTPLMLAADNESFVPDEVMQLLLNKGAQINLRDLRGDTALMIAARAGSTSGVAFLVGKGASVNLKNSAGQTALKIARTIHQKTRMQDAKLVEERIVATLLQAGAKE